ncbi:MAG: hypothetical protein HY241_07310 [Actinobacteria bacterium]|nr:hypothetical protein [Actinomycetota bacterium]
MADFENASYEVQTAWNDIAKLAQTALELAGLPATLLAQDSNIVGAEIEVDLGSDEAGGVFVEWRPLVRLSKAAAESVQSNRFDDPSIRHSGAVKLAMRRAIIEILSSAGFIAEESQEDMRPLSVRIVSAPKDDRAY